MARPTILKFPENVLCRHKYSEELAAEVCLEKVRNEEAARDGF